MSADVTKDVDSPAATPVPKAIASAAMDIALRQSRLLDSVVEFTDHRDIDALDHSLVLSLAELVSASQVALCKRMGDTATLDSVVRCIPDPTGAYVVEAAGALFAPGVDGLLRRSMLELQPALQDMADGGQRLIVPIQRDHRSIGALLLESPLELSGFRPVVDGFVRIYANYTVLLNESERDKLTGLFNRRTFERQLQRLLKQCAVPPERSGATARPDERRRIGTEQQTHVWLALLDIDHFKRINDVYGHVYGDEVILLMAQKMRASFRHNDVAFRFGGEEFVVLLCATDAAAAHSSLERFRDTVAQFDFPQVGHVTVSIGYAQVRETDYPEFVIDCADKALYFAKKNGRNRVYGYADLAMQGELPTSLIGSIDLF